MEEEIEDTVGNVTYSDSQKSVATTNQYSPDFTDGSSVSTNSNSAKNNSLSGKETYVIDCDSQDSDLHETKSYVTLRDTTVTKSSVNLNVRNVASTSTSLQSSVIAQETFTQTSKTIIQLAETEGVLQKVANETIETQTSFLSITESKTVEYRIEVASAHSNFSKIDTIDCTRMAKKPAYYNITCNPVLYDSLDGSSKFPVSEIDVNATDSNESNSLNDNDGPVTLIGDSSNRLSEHQDDTRYENTSDFESGLDTDIEEDSLITSDVRPKSDDSDVKELHNKLNETEDVILQMPSFEEADIRRFDTLTPLTEESAPKKGSLIDVTPLVLVDEIDPGTKDVLFTNSTGLKVKLLKGDHVKNNSKDPFKLPPIQNQSCPNSPHLNSLFVNNKPNRLSKAGTLPCLYEGGGKDSLVDRWEIGNKVLASGEGALISGRSGGSSRESPSIQLPPIHAEGPTSASALSRSSLPTPDSNIFPGKDPISIKNKIKDLKLSTKVKNTCPNTKNYVSKSDRSNSPNGASSPEDNGHLDIADRGCEVVCVELLRKLHSSDWLEVMATLEEIPRNLQKFWGVITEQRIADLIRQVNSHVESPRPTVARSACNTLACILKNTNYTKKPDFYESITTLLIKTGSYSRPLRRAANVALDDIVCGVDLSHAVTALCVHGARHKSALVRCAAARLLVVSCALAGGGRGLLRARPPTAAAARRCALRALAALLEDKNLDARKYAERLYSILRPLAHFEAYYLTDVDVEVASRQMKKYDRLLLCGSDTSKEGSFLPFDRHPRRVIETFTRCSGNQVAWVTY